MYFKIILLTSLPTAPATANISAPPLAPLPQKRQRSPPQAARRQRHRLVPARGRNDGRGRRGHRGGSFQRESKIYRSRRWKLQRVMEYERLPRNWKGARTRFLKAHKISWSNIGGIHFTVMHFQTIFYAIQLCVTKKVNFFDVFLAQTEKESEYLSYTRNRF